MINLYLMTYKGYEVLKALLPFKTYIQSVVGCRDKNIQKDYYEEIKALCQENNIDFLDRKDAKMLADKSSYSFAISWRWIIYEKDTRLIVFHDSLLPKYRGFNPLVSALINGEPKIGVTAQFATMEYDRGDIIRQQAVEIKYPIKIEKAIDLVSICYTELAVKIAEQIVRGEAIRATPQDEQQATYSLWRDEQDYEINWNKDAQQICRFIDAVGYPYQGASTFMDNKRVRILQAEAIEDVNIENRDIGKVIFMQQGQPIVVCAKGLLKITELIDDSTGDNLLPLSKFRVRFKA